MRTITLRNYIRRKRILSNFRKKVAKIRLEASIKLKQLREILDQLTDGLPKETLE